MIDLMNMLVTFLKGTPFTYYGEEIGMTNTPVPIGRIEDGAAKFVGRLSGGSDAKMKAARDPSRTPMQWDSSNSAGFSDSRNTWLPVNINKNRTNVEVCLGISSATFDRLHSVSLTIFFVFSKG